MIRVVEAGKDRRRIFRFVCAKCGCIYEATEDEGEIITAIDKPAGVVFNIDFNKMDLNEIQELRHVGMELECPMAFCTRKNKSFDIVNKEELEK